MWTEATTVDTITYEQPLKEHMRICLRLEHLFTQLKNHMMDPGIDSSKMSLAAILKTLDVINRPDLKSKLTQCLTQHATTLAQLEQFSQVDPERLKEILGKLDQLIASLHNNHNRIGERLNNNVFLKQLRLNLGNPGGTCAFANPAYALWLRKSGTERLKDLQIWAEEFKELSDIVDIILNLTRKSTPSQTIIAEDGFYHQKLNPALPCEMIRVNVSTTLGVFPEFSVGRHRLTIRFLIPNYQDNGHPNQLHEDIEFELSCCRL